MKSSNEQRCPSCNKTTLITDDNSGDIFCKTCVIVLSEGSNVIKNNDIKSNFYGAIDIDSSNNAITNNSIQNGEDSIKLGGASNFIYNNTLTNCGHCIGGGSFETNTIVHNTLQSWSIAGIRLESDYIGIENYFSGSGTDI